MSRIIKGNGKHLTYSDRVYIEQELMQRSSFRSIASTLGKDPSTISKEIRLHCAIAPPWFIPIPTVPLLQTFQSM